MGLVSFWIFCFRDILIASIGTYLASSLRTALDQSKKQRENFEDHNATYDKDLTDKWKKMLYSWYEDPDFKPDPFEEPASGTGYFCF